MIQETKRHQNKRSWKADKSVKITARNLIIDVKYVQKFGNKTL